MEQQKYNLGTIVLIIVGLVSFSFFLYYTQLFFNPLVLTGIAVYTLANVRREAPTFRALFILVLVLFAFWLLRDLGMVLLPFFISFFLAYLCDPLVIRLERLKIPRWLSALSLIIGFGGIIVSVSVFAFPKIFLQLDDIIRLASSFVNNAQQFLVSRKFYSAVESLGLPKETLRDIIQNEVAPRIEAILTTSLESLLALLNSLSTLASQTINIILIPILTFYFIKDIPKFKTYIKETLTEKNAKLFVDIHRINDIVRTYFGWQIIAAVIIGVSSSLLFTVLGVPYPIALGVMCGLLNPIPIFGSLASMAIASLTALLAQPNEASGLIITIVSVVAGLHAVNAYIFEPKVLGARIGLHPIVLLASLFVFGHFLGFLGLIAAVPITAALAMFLRDWREKSAARLKIETENSNVQFAKAFVKKTMQEDS